MNLYKFDWIAAILVALLLTTVLAYFFGVIPYPFGWVILTAALILRLMAVGNR